MVREIDLTATDTEERARSRRARIERLRRRLDNAAFRNDAGLIAILKGILDLLEDEL